LMLLLLSELLMQGQTCLPLSQAGRLGEVHDCFV